MVVLAACASPSPPPAPWIYEAPLALGPRPPVIGGFGRGARPLSMRPGGLIAGPGVSGGPAVVEELIAADDGAPEAIGFGNVGDRVTLELYDIDAGVVRWRNTSAVAPPRSLAGDVVIASTDRVTVGIGRRDGVERWRVDGAYRARDGALVAVAGADGVLLLDASSGVAQPPRAAPDGLPASAIFALCAAPTPHLYAFHEGQLMRWDVVDSSGGAGAAGAGASGGPGAGAGHGATLVKRWSVGGAPPARLDGCGGTVLLVGGEPRQVVALDPATGAIVGGPIIARDFWPARRGDGIEIATPEGIEARDRRLGSPRPLQPVRVGRMVARRGLRRLVARGDGGLVLLDEHGARAIAEPFGVTRVALGDQFLIGGPWSLPARTFASRVTRYLLPPIGAVAPPHPPFGDSFAGDPPRIDLPAPEPLPDAVELAGAGAWAVGMAVIDPSDPARLYVQVLEDRPSETRGAGVAAFDLRGRTWLWHAPDACPPGMPVALTSTASAVICGARQTMPGTGAVRAVDRRDGRTLWDWRGITVDGVQAASRRRAAVALPGMADDADVVLVSEGARVIALDPASGVERVWWRATDGWLPRVVLVRGESDVRVVSLEHGHLVMRSAAFGLRPLRSIEVRGVVSSMFGAGEHVAVGLTDGSAYLVDGDGAAVAAAALSPAWNAAGEDIALTATDATGSDGVLATFGGDGAPRVEATVPGSGVLAVAQRAATPGAPLALVGHGGSRVIVLTAAGRALRVVDLPPDAPRTPVVATAVDGRGVVAAVLARPLGVAVLTAAQ